MEEKDKTLEGIENKIIKEAEQLYKEACISGDWLIFMTKLEKIYRKYAYSTNKDEQQAMANVLSKRANKDSELYEIIYGKFGFNVIAIEQEELLPDDETYTIGKQYLDADSYKKFLVDMNPCHKVAIIRKVRFQEIMAKNDVNSNL